MDDLLAAFLNPDKPLTKIVIPGSNVVLGGSDSDDDSMDEQEDMDVKEVPTEYMDTYREREMEMYSNANRLPYNDMEHDELSMVDAISDIMSVAVSCDVQQTFPNHALDVYSKFVFDNIKCETYPIDVNHEEIVGMIEAYPVVVIQGPTGCGKTTQVPQFILDDCRTQGKPCNIIVTQPRRLAAISVARRVAEERGWGVGTVVGYQVGLEPCKSADTVLLYATTGVVLQKIIRQKNLHEFTHIIIDEVHERDMIMDFLLMVVRRYVFTNSPLTKVILMSATIDAERFANYFKWSTPTAEIDAAPIITIGNEAKYSTQIFYTNQLEFIGHIPDYKFDEPKIDKLLYKLFVVLLAAFDKLDVDNESAPGEKIIGNVLVFLPGILEIEEAYAALTAANEKRRNGVQWMILPLHSSITSEEQRNVFVPPIPGQRKIILSTNIAESSITVPDIVYVIDFCLTKAMILNPESQYQSLQLRWASHDSCLQRAGRVGRVSDGRVYRMVPIEFYEQYLPASAEPEILRAPLEQVVLSSKLLEMNEPPKALLSLVLDPPQVNNINSTVLFLKEIGGLTRLIDGELVADDGDITILGRVMATLPINVQLSKLIVLGHMFSCLQECIVMAAGCSLHNLFQTPFLKRFEAYVSKLQWADGSCCDLIAYLNLYKVWTRRQRADAELKANDNWTKLNFVNQRELKEWQALVKDIKIRLADMGIKPSATVQGGALSELHLPIVIKTAICGAFYPNYFLRSASGGQVDEREAVKIIGGRDPCNTVYFTGFPTNQPGPLYAKHIKNYFNRISSNAVVEFDKSSKVYVHFPPKNTSESVTVDGQILFTAMPGRIQNEVYHAVRMRQLKLDCTIPVISPQKATEMMEKLGAEVKQETTKYNCYSTPMPSVLPKMKTEYLKIRVSEVVNAGHFWAHNIDDFTQNALLNLDMALNDSHLQPVHFRQVTIGGVYAARFPEDDRFYRCKVLSIKEVDHNCVTQILFIDYGNVISVNISQLKHLPKVEIMNWPPQAFECVLYGVEPSAVIDSYARWTDKASNLLRSCSKDIDLYGKVFSVVHGIVHLELYTPHENSPQVDQNESFNARLIRLGLAQGAEESFLSKENHEKRVQALMSDNVYADYDDCSKENVKELEPPPLRDCCDSITLKGPFSTLETKVYCATSGGRKNTSKVEGHSVNAVLLDSDSQDPHARLLVAVEVGQAATSESLILRHTTIMPNIHGLPMLMCLLFCPTMEPKPTKDGSRIASVLCGIGAVKKSTQSLYPAHDICLHLDTILTENELFKINEIRYWMNMIISIMDNEFHKQNAPMDINMCQAQVRQKLLDLLQINRESREPDFVKKPDCWGKTEYDSEMLLPGRDEASMMKDAIWPLHWTIKVIQKSRMREEIERNLNEIQSIANQAFTVNEVNCQLCLQTFYSTASLRMHIATEGHKKRARDLQRTT